MKIVRRNDQNYFNVEFRSVNIIIILVKVLNFITLMMENVDDEDEVKFYATGFILHIYIYTYYIHIYAYVQY